MLTSVNCGPDSGDTNTAMHRERKDITVYSVKDKEFGTEVSLQSSCGSFWVEVKPGEGSSLPLLRLPLSQEQFAKLSEIATASGNEIEKKYRLSAFPDVALSVEGARYRQDYLAISADGTEVRIRSIDERIFKMTFKVGHGLARGEAEVDIDAKQYEALLPYANGKVDKDHYAVPGSIFTGAAGVRKFEFNVHREPLTGLYILEIEADDLAAVPAIEQAVAAHFPGAEDVTENKAYKAATLARKGRPA